MKRKKSIQKSEEPVVEPTVAELRVAAREGREAARQILDDAQAQVRQIAEDAEAEAARLEAAAADREHEANDLEADAREGADVDARAFELDAGRARYVDLLAAAVNAEKHVEMLVANRQAADRTVVDVEAAVAEASSGASPDHLAGLIARRDAARQVPALVAAQHDTALTAQAAAWREATDASDLVRVAWDRLAAAASAEVDRLGEVGDQAAAVGLDAVAADADEEADRVERIVREAWTALLEDDVDRVETLGLEWAAGLGEAPRPKLTRNRFDRFVVAVADELDAGAAVKPDMWYLAHYAERLRATDRDTLWRTVPLWGEPLAAEVAAYAAGEPIGAVTMLWIRSMTMSDATHAERDARAQRQQRQADADARRGGPLAIDGHPVRVRTGPR